MNVDDAKAFWQSQAPLPDIAMPEGDVLELVKQKSRAFDATIRRRDWREILALVVAVLLISPVLLRPSWLARAGVMVIVAGGMLIYWKLSRARRHAGLGLTLPLAAMLRAERAKVDAQIRLLESVLWWYLVPLGVGTVMVVAGDLGATWFTFWYAVFTLLLWWAIHMLNRRAVDRGLRPQRDKLTQLLQQLTE